MLVATLVLSSLAGSTPINVLIITDDEQIGQLTDGLSQYPDFGSITVIPWTDPPLTSALSEYDAVVVTKQYNINAYATAWGDLLADFARDGGGVTCGFAYYSTTFYVTDYGRLQLPENNPFTRGYRIITDATLGEILIPGHPLMENINQLMTAYRYDIQSNANAVVVANFNDGLPLAGYMETGAGRVVGIEMHYRLDPIGTNNGDYMQLYRNAVVFSVAKPRMLSVSVEGADARIEWRGVGGSRHVLQAATNLLAANPFTDISPPIALSGPGFVSTNHLDVGALTNHPVRFYRVRSG